MIKGFDHVAIISSSEDSVEFYKRLGFREMLRKEREYDTVVILEVEGIRLEIFIDANHPARATNPENIGFRHLAMKVNDIEYMSNQFNCGPIMTDWFGKRYCYAADPDGLPIEFHE